MPIQRYRPFESHLYYPDSQMNAQFAIGVKAGGFPFLRGQTGFDLDGQFHGTGDPTAQTDQAFANIETLLHEAGMTTSDICRITVFLTDRAHREAVYRVIGERLRDVFPCSTGLIVNGLALPEMLVEIDVVAWSDSTDGSPSNESAQQGESTSARQT